MWITEVPAIAEYALMSTMTRRLVELEHVPHMIARNRVESHAEHLKRPLPSVVRLAAVWVVVTPEFVVATNPADF